MVIAPIGFSLGRPARAEDSERAKRFSRAYAGSLIVPSAKG
jgi:hypothetical protein